jgi:hypothetical protein
MISSNIFYFSILCISWISFVRAYLTPEQNIEIAGFWNYHGDDLHDAFKAVRPSTVDAYYWDWIMNFQYTLGPYLVNLDVSVLSGQNQAPQPDGPLGARLAGIPNIVYLIRYSNLTILKDIKDDWVSMYRKPISSRSLLGMIDDNYVTSVWNDYATYHTKQQPRQSEAYIIFLVVLFSMNRTMLDIIPKKSPLHEYVVPRLGYYQTMINLLLSGIARYMQITTLIPYYRIFDDYQVEFIRLADALIDERNIQMESLESFQEFQNELGPRASAANSERDIRIAKLAAFEDFKTELNRLSSPTIREIIHQIEALAYHLSDRILPMIAIYGLPLRAETPFIHWEYEKSGPEIISDLFKKKWEIRRLVGQEIYESVGNARWLRQVLNSLEMELRNIDNRKGPWSPWMEKLRPMLNLALYVLNTEGAGTSGTS